MQEQELKSEGSVIQQNRIDSVQEHLDLYRNILSA